MGLLSDISDELRHRLEGEVLGAGELHVNSNPKQVYLGLSDQWLVILDKKDEGVDLRLLERDGSWSRHRLRSQQELVTLWDTVRDTARFWKRRVTVHGLRPGRRYKVLRTFKDFTGDTFVRGEELTFAKGAFLPYEGGHTLTFRERVMFVRDDMELYARFGLFVDEVLDGES